MVASFYSPAVKNNAAVDLNETNVAPEQNSGLEGGFSSTSIARLPERQQTPTCEIDGSRYAAVVPIPGVKAISARSDPYLIGGKTSIDVTLHYEQSATGFSGFPMLKIGPQRYKDN